MEHRPVRQPRNPPCLGGNQTIPHGNGRYKGNNGRPTGPRQHNPGEPPKLQNMSSPANQSKNRTDLLNGLPDEVLEGYSIQNVAENKRFLEAICNRTDKPDLLERLASSPHSCKTLRYSLPSNDSQQFFNNEVSKLLGYLREPSLKRLCGGQILNQVLWAIVDPPIFWDRLVDHAKKGILDSQAYENFAWLLLQLVLSPPSESGVFRKKAVEMLNDGALKDSPSTSAKGIWQKIQVIVKPSLHAPRTDSDHEFLPGGRHDNDFVSHHDIAILPTRAELQTSERPYYRHYSAVRCCSDEVKPQVHLDNQFRLLREDMLADMRETLVTTNGANKKRQKRVKLVPGLKLIDMDHFAMARNKPCFLVFESKSDILHMGKQGFEARKKALKNRPNFLKHQSFGCLMRGGELLAFASLERNEDMLANPQPQLCLRIHGKGSLYNVLQAARTGDIDFLQVPTPIFAYEPVLERLQAKTDIELDLFGSAKGVVQSPIQPIDLIEGIEGARDDPVRLTDLLKAKKRVDLDPSQIDALVMALKHQTSLIQGPPGTGKSFVGALLAKALFDYTPESILVLSYTNHALDQFLEDLMDIGIARDSMVRLGSKSSSRTESLLASKCQVQVPGKRTRSNLIGSQLEAMSSLRVDIHSAHTEYKRSTITMGQIREHIEFSGFFEFEDAFKVPDAEEGEIRIGKKGARIGPDYLLAQWLAGKGPGALFNYIVQAGSGDIWRMSKKERLAKKEEWEGEIKHKTLVRLVELISRYQKAQKIHNGLRKERLENLLSSKRIIGCTTTAASMYAQEIQAATPGVILVEEAGEILESHIIAAMSPSTKQLIQIGDHKQLRPKIKNHRLSVESGNGYDLNRSLFERLILEGQPHSMLSTQHRMRPEISKLIRHNYPNLQDAPTTKYRDHLLGFQNDVVFFTHEHPETYHNTLIDAIDQGETSSPQNPFEADMVLKVVRYLGQQGYKTDDLVILTPYLGQLLLLRSMLARDHDPVLNDLDSHDLIAAGELSSSSAQVHKRPIKLSTIDNYQGEEADIVVISMTRSNMNGVIGFMCAPERLNVMISRARNALIMIGNADTFLNAKKGREEWCRLFDQLKAEDKIHNGFPLRCEKHLRPVIVRTSEDFDLHAPDGGCAQPCSELLPCSKHRCPMRCHIRVDHSKVLCREIVHDVCSRKHRLTWECCDKRAPPCQTCRREDEEKAKKDRRDKLLEQERQYKQLAYSKKLAQIQEEITKGRKVLADRQEDRLKQQTIQQKSDELAKIKQQIDGNSEQEATSRTKTPHKKESQGSGGKGTARKTTVSQQPVPEDWSTPIPGQYPVDEKEVPETDAPERFSTSDKSSVEENNESDGSDNNDDSPPSPKLSPAENDWERQKMLENASNEALDSLMGMIGLESVKQEFLNIKSKVDTALRQGIDLKDERLGAALLGNPGTGKTTVARLYAKFLSSVGALPGDHFEETTGSRLANDGVKGCQTLIDNLLAKGGGVFFLDEAYQIVSTGSFGGTQVLDFLLAEIENLTGKVAFVFAGYAKPMEAFFAHNVGIPSRIPGRFTFDDYEDNELLRILNYRLDKKYNDRMKTEKGPYGLYMRIVARRIGRGRGREGFGNAREVQNVLSLLLTRQARRIHHERRRGCTPDDLLLTKTDLIGPEPNKTLAANKDWKKLKSLIGLQSVKDSIEALLNRLETNYQRELREMPLVDCSLNKVFVGNPGTGKTTVAKIYGRILAALGLLSNGEVVVKNPADFVGGAMGQSEKNTKAILDSTKGKVLIIDEAYMLASGGSSDPYRTAVVNTIVAEVQSTALEDRCVLLLGYREQMESMFNNVNPGLKRRFPIDSGFDFEDFDDAELGQILDLKLKEQDFRAGQAARRVALEVLGRARNRPNFGNAGEVDILLDQAKERQQRRVTELQKVKGTSQGIKDSNTLEARDIDPDFDRGERGITNIRMLFKDVVGCDEIVEQLEEYQQVAQAMKSMDGMDPRDQLPFGFLFKGPPGTGKTTTARKMGKVYYDLGFLADARVVECSATDLVGQFVGQTGPKVQAKFDESLGHVLFVDEAYRLAEGPYAKEAMDEIVDCMTKERYRGRMVIILAGYDEEMNRLMAQNPGLTSRFPETVTFSHLPARYCIDLLVQCLRAKKLDTTALEKDGSISPDASLLHGFNDLSAEPGWANARDVQTLAKSIFTRTLRSQRKSKTALSTTDNGARPQFPVTRQSVLEALESMRNERRQRSTEKPPNFEQLFASQAQKQKPQQHIRTAPPPSAPTFSTSKVAIETDSAPPEVEKEIATHETSDSDESEDNNRSGYPIPTRDAGVSDEVWQQLQDDTMAFRARQAALERGRRDAAKLEQKEAELSRVVKEKKEAKGSEEEDQRREVLKKLERVRRKKDRILKEQREREEREKKEQEMRERLRRMGRCPVGYEWIPQQGGFRCAGGSHWIRNEDLDKL